MPRNRDTSAATLSRRMRKWRRWALEMNESGLWECKPIEPQTEPARPATTETEEN